MSLPSLSPTSSMPAGVKTRKSCHCASTVSAIAKALVSYWHGFSHKSKTRHHTGCYEESQLHPSQSGAISHRCWLVKYLDWDSHSPSALLLQGQVTAWPEAAAKTGLERMRFLEVTFVPGLLTLEGLWCCLWWMSLWNSTLEFLFALKKQNTKLGNYTLNWEEYYGWKLQEL